MEHLLSQAGLAWADIQMCCIPQRQASVQKENAKDKTNGEEKFKPGIVMIKCARVTN